MARAQSWRNVRRQALSYTALVSIPLIFSVLGTAKAQQEQDNSISDVETSDEAGPPVTLEEIEEIVVTARRREETLLDVPSSVTAVSDDQLRTFNASEIGDIQGAVPNLVLHEGDAQNTVAYIRGVGQIDSLAFAEPGVGIYLDDVYLGRAQGSFLDVFDVERIEVLRGPQGTLYGRNTIGGAIKFVSRAPTTTPEARASITYGNYNRVDAKARVSGPLVGDRLLGKAAFAYLRRDGFADNAFDGEDDGGRDTLAFRTALLGRVSDRIEVEISADGSFDTPDTSRTPSRETPVFGFPPNDDPFEVNADFNGLSDLKVWGVAANATWDVTDSLEVKSITSYREMSYDANLDLDATPSPIFGTFVFQDQEQFSQELRFTYSGARFDAVAGIYYFQESDVTESGIFGPAIAFISNSINDQETDSYAVFADGTYQLTSQLEASLGLRFTYEEKDFARVQEFFDAETEFVPQISEGLRVTDVDVSEDFDDLSPRFSLSYKPLEDLNFYASVSRGFKSGGFDGRSDDAFQAVPFEAETLWAYEAGAKGRFLGGRLTGSFAYFYNDYNDLQVSSFTADETGSFAAIFTNAAEARITGFELEAQARPLPGLRLDLALGYMDADYQEFTGEDGEDISDELTPAQSPPWTVRIGGEYQRSLFGEIVGIVAADMQYRGETFPTVSSSEVLRQGGYTLVNASIGLEFSGGRYALRGVGRNLTDERYIQQGFDLSDSLGYQLGYFGAPRTFSVTASVRL